MPACQGVLQVVQVVGESILRCQPQADQCFLHILVDENLILPDCQEPECECEVPGLRVV